MVVLERWQIDPFERFHEQHHRRDDLLHMLREAVHWIQARPVLIEHMRAEWGENQTDREVAQAQHNAAIAVAEAEAGHPLLHAQAVILLWGDLEALLSDFLASWLTNKPETRALDAVRNLKLGLGEYESLSGDDRAAYLLEKLQDRLGSKRAGGIERFELLFRLFGLTSQLDAQTVRDLLELSAVRNLLVHRRGVVDTNLRFKNQCSWGTHAIGSELVVSHDDCRCYFDAVDLYVFEVTQRLLVYHGLPRSRHKPTCRFHAHGKEPNTPLQPTSGAGTHG
jgi:hypothetical protein